MSDLEFRPFRQPSGSNQLIITLQWHYLDITLRHQPLMTRLNWEMRKLG